MPNQDENQAEEKLITSLRAASWAEFFGQEKIKEALKISISAAKKRRESLEHILFYGPPGLGKTTLAHIIATEMGKNIKVTSGPALERAGDLAAILTNLEDQDILFIDEIHRLNRVVEETLYPAMEDYALDIILGKGPSARTLRIDLPRFTIIGATTRIGLLTSPMRDRFGLVHRLSFYDTQHLAQVISQAAQKLNIDIDQESTLLLAQRSRGTPRIALRLLKRVRDVAQVKGKGTIDSQILTQTFVMLELDELGLDRIDRKLLTVVIDKHGGGPVGLETIAAAISEDKQTIEEVIEPYLLKIGVLKRTPRGRVVTIHGYEHLGRKINPEDLQRQLF